MKKILIILLILASGLLWAQSAKKAMIINYTYGGSRLPNDVGGLIAKLNLLSYAVLPVLNDPPADNLKAQISQWISKLSPGDNALIYVHAFSEKANSKNCIVTGAPGPSRELYDLSELFKQLKKQSMEKTTTVILDVMSRNEYHGDNISKMDRVSTVGVLTLYSHLPGQTYEDPNSDKTLVVKELTNALGVGYASMNDLLEYVAGKIRTDTQNPGQAQIPFVEGNNTLRMEIPPVTLPPKGVIGLIKSEPIGSGAAAVAIVGALIYGSVKLLTPRDSALPDPPGLPPR